MGDDRRRLRHSGSALVFRICYWMFRGRTLKTDGKLDDSAAPNFVVLCNLWIVAGYFRSFRHAHPKAIEMDRLKCCFPTLLPPVTHFPLVDGDHPAATRL